MDEQFPDMTDIAIMRDEVARLRQFALERYDQDMGFMYETTDASDYDDLVKKHGSAEAAWAAHMKTHEAQKESGGFYERW